MLWDWIRKGLTQPIAARATRRKKNGRKDQQVITWNSLVEWVGIVLHWFVTQLVPLDFWGVERTPLIPILMGWPSLLKCGKSFKTRVTWVSQNPRPYKVGPLLVTCYNPHKGCNPPLITSRAPPCTYMRHKAKPKRLIGDQPFQMLFFGKWSRPENRIKSTWAYVSTKDSKHKAGMGWNRSR